MQNICLDPLWSQAYTQICLKMLFRTYNCIMYKITRSLNMIGADVHADMYFCRIPHRRTPPNTHFLAPAVAHLDWLVHLNVFFPLSQPTRDSSSTQMLSFLCGSLHNRTHPHASFLSTDIKTFSHRRFLSTFSSRRASSQILW